MFIRNHFLLGGALCLSVFSTPSGATGTPPVVTTPVGGSPASEADLSSQTISASAAAAAAAASQSATSTTIDASSNYRSRSIFIPPVVPGTPSSQLAAGDIIKETSVCGPLQRIVRQPVTGTFIGLFRNASVAQGWSDDLEPYRDDSGAVIDYRTERLSNGDVRMFGHQVTMFTTVVGVASNRNIALGGGSGGGSWGQGGMGSSSSNQRMVTNIQLRDCEIGTMRTVLVEVPPKAIRR